MSVLASIIIIIILSVVKNPCDAVRPVVTFTPHWKIVYEGDTVTMSCDVEAATQHTDYSWYKNSEYIGQYVQKYTITSAEEKDGGDYMCRAGGDYSLPARLHVITKGSAERPVVTFTPNWRKIFTWETVTITCDTGSTVRGNQRYYWYKDKVILYEEKQRNITITYAAPKHSGEYQCRAGSGDVSLPVRLEVSIGSLILQAPPNVYEGDTLTLRCHSRPLYKAEKEAVFHIGSKDIKSEQNILDIPNVTTTMTGIYGCTGKVGGDDRKDETFISIQALFDTPQITTYWSSVTEGYAMTLTCYTKRNPARSATELHFAFYRDGQNVQDFSASATYSVLAVQLVHSGYYTCDVSDPSGSVRKRSDAFHIQVQELFSYPEIKLVHTDIITEGAGMTLTCNTVIKHGYTLKPQFAFYRDGHTVQDFSASATYSVPSAQPVHSGNYTCDVRSPRVSVRKRSNVLCVQIKVGVDQPQLKLLPEAATVGDEIVLLCESRNGSLPIHYRFYHNGTLLGNITVHDKKAAVLSLTISSLTMAGPYYCDSGNYFFPQHQQSDTVHLLVMAPVVNMTVTTDNEDEGLAFGSPVTMTCSIQRASSPSYLWLHNDEVVERDSEMYQLRDEGAVLYIESLTRHHTGTYRCNASIALTPSTAYSVLSNTQDINVQEQSPADRNILWPALGILLLLILILTVLLFLYRHRLAPVLARCHRKQPPADVTVDKPAVRVGERPMLEDAHRSDTRDNDLGEYSYITPTENHANEDVCYAYIDINRKRAASDTAKDNDDFSVMYSVVKYPGDTVKTQTTEETSDSTNIYQNFTKAH
ncbi:Fc receptor-like protein 5 [Pseudophryne corroboree]|uniref:Fc receptor-like protein 5 n=1 Tax=Pseudophryne corroboree TaxID=495146 RepID=UPI003081FE0C